MTVGEAWSSGMRVVRGPRAREFALFAGSTVMYQAARFAFSLAAARALFPADFTGWALTAALLVYAPSLLLGTINGLGRELPILIGRGGGEAADRAVAAAWSATLAGALVTVAGAAAINIAAGGANAAPMLVGLLAAGTILYGTQQFILRSQLRFDAASAQQALFGAIGFASAAILAISADGDFESAALLYGTPLAAAVALGVVLVRPPFPPRLALHEARRLAAIGFPIMLAGLVFSLFVTLDRWVAVTLLGPERAAPYALASLIAAAMLVVPTVVSQQTYPRMAIARGRDATAQELLSMARKQGWLAAALVAPIAGAVALFAWLVVPVFTPGYAAAALPAVILSLGFVVLGYLTGYGNYLNVVGGQWRYLGAQLVGVAVALALMVAGARLFGLVGIALGMAVSYVVYGLVLRGVAVRTGLIGDQSEDGARSR